MKIWSGFYFFFQAEDGKRDADVTGVQTCALPIFTYDISERFGEEFLAFQDPDGLWLHLIKAKQKDERKGFRSEERRVGKECRSRYGTYHMKKLSYFSSILRTCGKIGFQK